jgi:hypothetical protein
MAMNIFGYSAVRCSRLSVLPRSESSSSMLRNGRRSTTDFTIAAFIPGSARSCCSVATFGSMTP